MTATLLRKQEHCVENITKDGSAGEILMGISSLGLRRYSAIIS